MKIIDFITDYRFKIFNTHWWHDFWYQQISSRFNPRQQWLTNKIPRTWIDKDTLWEICIFEGIKHYVDFDHGLGYNSGDYEYSQSDPTYPEHQKIFDREVKENYDLIVKKLPELEKEIELAWKTIPHFDWKNPDAPRKNFQEIYGKVTKLEDDYYNLKTKIMAWAISNRGSIWT